MKRARSALLSVGRTSIPTSHANSTHIHTHTHTHTHGTGQPGAPPTSTEALAAAAAGSNEYAAAFDAADAALADAAMPSDVAAAVQYLLREYTLLVPRKKPRGASSITEPPTTEFEYLSGVGVVLESQLKDVLGPTQVDSGIRAHTADGSLVRVIAPVGDPLDAPTFAVVPASQMREFLEDMRAAADAAVRMAADTFEQLLATIRSTKGDCWVAGDQAEAAYERAVGMCNCVPHDPLNPVSAFQALQLLLCIRAAEYNRTAVSRATPGADPMASTHMNKAGALPRFPDVIAVLLRNGLLVRRTDAAALDAASSSVGRTRDMFWLGAPESGRMWHACHEARKDIIRRLQRRTHKEAPRREVEAFKLSSSPLPTKFHVRDLVGSSLLVELNVASGIVLRVK